MDHRMRLHVYLDANMELILQGWEDFARSIWPSNEPPVEDLRDHAEDMLRAVIADLQVDQSEAQQFNKSVGQGESSEASDAIDLASNRHAVARVDSGFDLRALVAEYRALRASVLHHWTNAPDVSETDRVEDMIRFNESIDQLLAESIVTYSHHVDHSREVFLGILGHDLRTPLHSAILGAEMLVSHRDLAVMPKKLASQILISAREMERMIRDLLDFTTTRLGAHMELSPKPMDLVALGKEVLDEMRIAHPRVEFELQAECPVNGEWDRSRLRQLVSNLTGNAVQHGSSVQPIVVTIGLRGEDVYLSVTNGGTPIPKDLQIVIFDPMRRNADSSNRRSGSIGLGLYIAKEVAAAHGGSIEVRSDTTATTFTVTLPRRTEPPAGA
jgi:signal transduction histidine kinase